MSISRANLSGTSNFQRGRKFSDISKNYNVVDFFQDGSGIALWRLDENISDLSGNYNGVSSSNVTYSTVDKKIGIASGVFAGNASISMPTVKNSYPLSVSMWVQDTNAFNPSTSGMRELFNMSIAGQRLSLGNLNNPGWPIGLTIMYGGSNHWSGSVSAFSPNSTNFFHIVFSIVGSNNASHAAYFNGNAVTLTNNGGAHGGAANWALGSNGASAEFWSGKIDHVRFFNKALSQTEVSRLYDYEKS
jgi:hypothetical protein